MEGFDPRQAFHCFWPPSQSPLLRQTNITQPDLPLLLPGNPLTQRKLIHLHVLHVSVHCVCNQHFKPAKHTSRRTQNLLYAITVLMRVMIRWHSRLYT